MRDASVAPLDGVADACADETCAFMKSTDGEAAGGPFTGKLNEIGRVAIASTTTRTEVTPTARFRYLDRPSLAVTRFNVRRRLKPGSRIFAAVVTQQRR